MNYADLPAPVKEAWDNKPEDVPFVTIGEIFDRWCDYEGLINWGPKLRATWLELQRIQSLENSRRSLEQAMQRGAQILGERDAKK